MINPTALKVSLTKHGAHKIATLLRIYPADEVLANLSGSVDGVNIEAAQAKKTLAADKKGNVPALWEEARADGALTDALVLIAIIVSHHDLIEALRSATDKGPYVGTVKKGDVIDGKAFTNFKHILIELGYSTSDNETQVSFDFRGLFKMGRLSDFTSRLLQEKFKTVGWTGETSVEDEAVNLRLHEAFGITEEQLRSWLEGASTPALPKAA